MKRLKNLLVVLCILIPLVTSCTSNPVKYAFHDKAHSTQSEQKDRKEAAVTLGENAVAKNQKFSAWITYWDCDNVPDEMRILGNKLNQIIYFAAYFNKDSQLFIPEETLKTFQRKENGDDSKTRFLSIVNDKINNNGTTSLKSTDLLYELLSDKKASDKHIEDIISITRKEGFDGVEIDYEGIKKDIDLWNKFLEFTTSLYKKLKDNNLKMRIVLEASAPLDKLKFPEGPEYVMMCYNLHGPGNSPGPKADRSFVQGLVDKMEGLPGKKSFAFATGGFDWDDSGNALAITEQAAGALLKRYSITPVRDENSNALTFEYTDQDGANHEVWFADGTTISEWINCIDSNKSYGVSIWRLNGNDDKSLELLAGRKGD